MINELLNKTTNKDYIVMFSLLEVSRLLKKEDFRLLGSDIFIRQEVLPLEQEQVFISKELEVTWDNLKVILPNIEGYVYLSFYDIPLQYKYSLYNANCFSYYFQPNIMYKPLDIRLISKIEVFDSNGSFKDSWEKLSTSSYTSKQQEYIDLINNNYNAVFKVNELYEGYLQINPNNFTEIMILDSLSNIGKAPEDIPFYQVIKINSITTLNIINEP